MNKIAKITVLAIGAAMVTQALQAQSDSGSPVANDLVLGFTTQASGVTQDYLLDLGQIPLLPNTQLGGISLSAFSNIFGAAATSGNVYTAIVGGSQTGAIDFYTSTLDDGTGTALTAGSTAPVQPGSKSLIANAAAIVGGMTMGAVAQSAGFQGLVAVNPTTVGSQPNNVAFTLGSNPLTTLPGSETLTLDIWKDSTSGRSGDTGFSYVGDISLNLSGSTLSAVWDPTVVSAPEPSTYGLLAVGGVMAVVLRRKYVRKNA